MRPPVNYCQVCGHSMEDRVAFGKPHRVCPDCGYIHFRDPKVAAVVFIENNEQVLLIRRAMNPERGKWALPAGYIDDGEDPREAAVREAREETGLEVTITGLLDVQQGPVELGASIIIIYAAQVTSGQAKALDDADAILWFSAHDPLPELAFDSTRTLLDDWIRQRRNVSAKQIDPASDPTGS